MITKTEPSRTVVSPYTMVSNRGFPGSQPQTKNYTLSQSVNGSTITYDEGPKYIGTPRHCNWKQCWASSSGGRPVTVPTVSIHSYGHGQGANHHLSDEMHLYDVPWAGLSTYGLVSMAQNAPSVPSYDWSEISNEMWDDIAGRCNNSILVLEDLAGFFSGKSLFKGIWSVASAANSLVRGVRVTRKLAQAFGYRKSIYQTWTSAKDLVREIIGLRLGYRFSFKATLNDVAQAVDFATSFASYCDEMRRRQGQGMTRLQKTRTYRNVRDSSMTASAANSSFLTNFPDRSKVIRYVSGDTPAKRVSVGEAQIKLFCNVKVSYPADFFTVGHYYQGRFGLDKPLSTLWAIVPMSFVIDYLLNVQDMMLYLDNKLNDALVRASIYTAFATLKRERMSVFERAGYTTRYTTPGVVDPFIYTTTVPNLKAQYVASRTFSRTPYPVGSIRAELPPLINGESALRSTLTGLELLSQTRLR